MFLGVAVYSAAHLLLKWIEPCVFWSVNKKRQGVRREMQKGHQPTDVFTHLNLTLLVTCSKQVTGSLIDCR
jgi:hypothetical protein